MEKFPLSLLVSVQLPSVSDEENSQSMAELSRLTTTLGYKTTQVISQKKEAWTQAPSLVKVK